MIHEAECRIVIAPPQFGSLVKMLAAEPPIPSDEEISEVFPDWKAKAKVFLGRCFQEEGRSPMDQLLPQDFFRYGIKFAVVEAKKMV